MRRSQITFFIHFIVYPANIKSGILCREIKADIMQNKKCKIIYYFYGVKKSRLLLRLD